MAQKVKRLPAMRETWVGFLGREDPLEKEWQSTPALLPGKSHVRRSLIGYSPMGGKESDTAERLHFFFFYQLKEKNCKKQKCMEIEQHVSK